MAGGDVTPLPRRELTVLCGLVACAMFSFAVIYPFLPFLVGWYLPQLEDHQFGFFAGYLGSAFNLGSIFAAFFWGRLADAIGRRPVFLICIAALSTTTSPGSAPLQPRRRRWGSWRRCRGRSTARWTSRRGNEHAVWVLLCRASSPALTGLTTLRDHS